MCVGCFLLALPCVRDCSGKPGTASRHAAAVRTWNGKPDPEGNAQHALLEILITKNAFLKRKYEHLIRYFNN